MHKVNIMKENIRNTRHVHVYGVRLTVSCLLLVSDSLRSMHECEICLLKNQECNSENCTKLQITSKNIMYFTPCKMYMKVLKNTS